MGLPVDVTTARGHAERQLERYSTPEQPMVLLGPETVRDHGWCYVFLWNTARYAETRDRADSKRPGSGPIVVVKESGDTWTMGTWLPVDMQLERYAEQHGIAP